MDSKASADTRRMIANDNLPETVVQRLVERGVIQPGEGADMLALLSAISELSTRSMVAATPNRPHGRIPRGRRAEPA